MDEQHRRVDAALDARFLRRSGERASKGSDAMIANAVQDITAALAIFAFEVQEATTERPARTLHQAIRALANACCRVESAAYDRVEALRQSSVRTDGDIVPDDNQGNVGTR